MLKRNRLAASSRLLMPYGLLKKLEADREARW